MSEFGRNSGADEGGDGRDAIFFGRIENTWFGTDFGESIKRNEVVGMFVLVRRTKVDELVVFVGGDRIALGRMDRKGSILFFLRTNVTGAAQ